VVTNVSIKAQRFNYKKLTIILVNVYLVIAIYSNCKFRHNFRQSQFTTDVHSQNNFKINENFFLFFLVSKLILLQNFNEKNLKKKIKILKFS